MKKNSWEIIAAEQGKKSGISNANAFINKEKSIPNELISEKIELLKTFAAIPERWNKDKMYEEAFWETVESCSTYSEDEINILKWRKNKCN